MNSPYYEKLLFRLWIKGNNPLPEHIIQAATVSLPTKLPPPRIQRSPASSIKSSSNVPPPPPSSNNSNISTAQKGHDSFLVVHKGVVSPPTSHSSLSMEKLQQALAQTQNIQTTKKSRPGLNQTIKTLGRRFRLEQEQQQHQPPPIVHTKSSNTHLPAVLRKSVEQTIEQAVASLLDINTGNLRMSKFGPEEEGCWLHKAKVLWSYTARTEDELSLKVGEIVKVYKKNEEEWWGGENEQGKVGYFPASYVEILRE